MIKIVTKFIRNLIICLLLLIIFINGCSSDTPYTPPSKVELNSVHDTVIVSEPAKKQETPKTQIFKVGDTATDNQLKITLNNIKFVSKIDETNNEFSVAEPPSGKQYVVVDLTIENILPDKTQAISTFAESEISDQDGYSYNIDFRGLTALDKSFKDGEILPGMKRRGETAYLVPTSATDLKFIYKFDLFTGTTAVFNIK